MFPLLVEWWRQQTDQLAAWRCHTSNFNILSSQHTKNWMCSSLDCRERNYRPDHVISTQNSMSKCSFCVQIWPFSEVLCCQTGRSFLPCLYSCMSNSSSIQTLLFRPQLAWCMVLVYTSVTPCICTNLLFRVRHSSGARAQGKIQEGANKAQFRHS